MKSRVCELCNGEASLYCMSDTAYICWDCDARVHEANFLVARHVRRTLCYRCKGFDGSCVSGVGFRRIRAVCRHCLAEEGDSSCDSISSSLSCSSECVSSTESVAAKEKIGRGAQNRPGIERIARSGSDARARAILVIWSRRLGLRSGSCLALALRALGVCSRKFTHMPFRVCLASSLWLAANLCEPRGVSTCQLKRLEECSRVPQKLILAAESRLSRTVKLEKSSQEEGWAECSDG